MATWLQKTTSIQTNTFLTFQTCFNTIPHSQDANKLTAREANCYVILFYTNIFLTVQEYLSEFSKPKTPIYKSLTDKEAKRTVRNC